METGAKTQRSSVATAGILFLVCMFIAIAVGETPDLPTGLRVILSLLAPTTFTYVILQWRSDIRQLDELERRIQLEALATAFPLSILLVLTLGVLQRVIHLPFEDFSYRHLWAMLVAIYFVSLALARRRYS